MPVPQGYTLEAAGLPTGYTPDVAGAALDRLGGKKPKLPIQPFQPANDPRSAKERYMGGLGVPMRAEDLPLALAGGAQSALTGILGGPAAMMAQAGASAGTNLIHQLGSKDFAGAAGTLTAPALMALGTRGALHQGTVPMEFTGASEPGALRSFLQTGASELLPGMVNRLVQPLLRIGQGHSAGRIAVGDAPPPVGYSGTDFPMNSPKASGPIPEPQPVPSPPLRVGRDWFQPPKEATYGDAPKQPLIRPSGKGPRVQSSFEKNLEPPREIGPSGAIKNPQKGPVGSKLPPTKTEFIPDFYAKEGSVLPDGETVISSVSKDGKAASILRPDMKTGRIVRTDNVPVRKLSPVEQQHWYNMLTKALQESE